jgi:indole-3-glycerol phosphate synthase
MILDTIAASTKKRVKAAKTRLPKSQLIRAASLLPKGEFRFERALSQDGLSFLCEVKKASPSKGLIAPDFPYLDIARDYEQAGASAISVLTEPDYFLGNDRYLTEIAQTVSIPVLRKALLR